VRKASEGRFYAGCYVFHQALGKPVIGENRDNVNLLRLLLSLFSLFGHYCVQRVAKEAEVVLGDLLHPFRCLMLGVVVVADRSEELEECRGWAQDCHFAFVGACVSMLYYLGEQDFEEGLKNAIRLKV
jgi:hypothetical protein